MCSSRRRDSAEGCVIRPALAEARDYGLGCDMVAAAKPTSQCATATSFAPVGIAAARHTAAINAHQCGPTPAGAAGRLRDADSAALVCRPRTRADTALTDL